MPNEIGKPTHGNYHYIVRLSADEYANLCQAVLFQQAYGYSLPLSVLAAVAQPSTESGRYFGGKEYEDNL